VPKPSHRPGRLPKRRKRSSPSGEDQPLSSDEAKETPRVQSKDIQGLKYFDMLLPLLERLHDEQCGRDKAGNRELHFDKYCLLVLLYMFKLGEQATPAARDARLSQINQTITLIDGSIVSALPSLIQASVLKQTKGSGLVQWRLHTLDQPQSQWH